MRRVIIALLTVVAPLARLSADEARWRTGPEHVLVVYAADGPDRDQSGKPDSLDAAEYYAARRGVPKENLLGLSVARDKGKRGRWAYREFFEKVLIPVVEKLSDKAPGGGTVGEKIAYILMCPDTPDSMVTHPKPANEEESWSRKILVRSTDSFLIDPHANLKAGVAEDGFPGPGQSGPIGSTFRELSLPVFGAFRPGPSGRHFRQIRQQLTGDKAIYLVARLGADLDTARNMVDGALYAERYLRLPDDGEKTAFRPQIWLDMKYAFAGDHVASMSRTVAIVRGQGDSPFAAGEGLLTVWPIVMDTQPAQIGSGREQAHKPTVTATVAPDGVDATGITLKPPGKAGRANDISGVLYFPPGCKVECLKPVPPVSNSSPRQRGVEAPGRELHAPGRGVDAPNPRLPAGAGEPSTTKAAAEKAPPPSPQVVATATVVGADPDRHRLLLDSTKGFEGGLTVRYVWPGEFPTADCFLFYGFYGLGAFEDVRLFPPGSIGVHVDSCCMTWARGAVGGGVGATFGVTSEPLSAGIPYGHLFIPALAAGYDWAESAYGGLRLAQRWTGVVFGDPVYAPFRSKQLADEAPPAIEPVSVAPAGKGAVTVSAALAGGDSDRDAEVALFRLEYGPTDSYGEAVDFYEWPEPEKGSRVKGRRFGYSRHFRATLKDLQQGKTYHYRLIARDPGGLTTITKDATFTVE